jgi:hypothetical protein
MTYSLRPDPEIEAALRTLGVTPGNRSRIIKEAILALAKATTDKRLRAESERIAADPNDRAELRQVHEDLDSVRAW